MCKTSQQRAASHDGEREFVFEAFALGQGGAFGSGRAVGAAGFEMKKKGVHHKGNLGEGWVGGEVRRMGGG